MARAVRDLGPAEPPPAVVGAGEPSLACGGPLKHLWRSALTVRSEAVDDESVDTAMTRRHVVHANRLGGPRERRLHEGRRPTAARARVPTPMIGRRRQPYTMSPPVRPREQLPLRSQVDAS